MIDVPLPLETMQERAAEAADFMRLFSTPSRLMLLCYIAQKERSVGEIQDDLGFKQPGLSQHLGELRQAGVVNTRRASRQVYYSIADDRITVVTRVLGQMFCDTSSTAIAKAAHAQPSPIVSGTTAEPKHLGEMAHWARLEKID